MQLASSVAVGLAMFLLAMLLPVFLVAWKRRDAKEGAGKHKHIECTLHLCKASRTGTSRDRKQMTLVPGAGKGEQRVTATSTRFLLGGMETFWN